MKSTLFDLNFLIFLIFLKLIWVVQAFGSKEELKSSSSVRVDSITPLEEDNATANATVKDNILISYHPCLAVRFHSDILVSLKVLNVKPVEILDTYIPLQTYDHSNCPESSEQERLQNVMQKSGNENQNTAFVLNLRIPIPTINFDGYGSNGIGNRASLRISFFYDPIEQEYWLGNVYIEGVFSLSSQQFFQMKPASQKPRHAFMNSTSTCNSTSFIFTSPYSPERRHEATVILYNTKFQVFANTGIEKDINYPSIDVCVADSLTDVFKFGREHSGPSAPWPIAAMALTGFGITILIVSLLLGSMYYRRASRRGIGTLNKPSVSNWISS